MQTQIQQMKSSIANIQHHLRKLQHQQTIKTTHCNQNQHQNILPQSIIHQHTYQKPTPTPKITSTVPNIIHTDVYTPHRHHLDDTQMKKALKDNVNEFSESDLLQRNYHKDSNYNSKNKQKLNRKSCGKNRGHSSTIKTKYIYDGGRVVYVPPPRQAYSDYGHLIVESNHKKKKRNQSSSHINTYNNQNYNFNTQYQYGTLPTNILQNSIKKSNKNSKKQKNRQKTKQKSKSKSRFYQTQFQNKNTQYYQQQNERLKRQRQQQNTKYKKFKSTKIQCSIKKLKIKDPFILDWDPNTDSEFSQMEI